VSADDEDKRIWGKIEKLVARATDEYTSRPDISLYVSSIPIIGPIIDHTFRIKASEIQMGSIVTLFDALEAEISQVDKTKIDKQYLESIEGYDIFRKMLIATLETINNNKIRLYARILIRSAILDNSKFRYYSKDFISLLLELSPPDLQVARNMYKQQKDTPADEINRKALDEVEIVERSGFRQLRELLGLDKAEFDLALTKLVRAGLIRQVVGSYDQYTGDLYAITRTFRKMMELIEDPEYLK
jgi:DNA-binding MarR family transcriptional regulator